jgi:hypothetical protein
MDALYIFLTLIIYGVIPLFCVVQIIRIGRELEREMDLIYDNFDKRMDIMQTEFERSLQMESDFLDKVEEEMNK